MDWPCKNFNQGSTRKQPSGAISLYLTVVPQLKGNRDVCMQVSGSGRFLEVAICFERKKLLKKLYKLCISMSSCTGGSGQSWCGGLAGLEACVRLATQCL